MIASALLRRRATVAPFAGPTSEGPSSYGDQFEVMGRKVEKLVVVSGPNGVDLTSTVQLQIRPEPRIVAQSLLSLGTDVYEVVDIAQITELDRPHHDELILAGPRSGDLPEPGTQSGIDVDLDGGAP